MRFWPLLLVAAIGCGGGGGGGEGGGGGTNPPNRADFLIGAGLVQGWPAVPREIVDANADAGLTFTEVEWVSDQSTAPCPPHGPRTNDFFGTDPAAYAELVDEARKRDVVVLVDIANANNCAVMSQPDSWFLKQLDEILSVGLDHVLVSPVSEPGASPRKAAHWLVLTRDAVPPDHLVDIPIHGAPAAAYTDVHFCNPEILLRALERGEPSIIHNTDCSTLLDPGPTFAAELATAAAGTGSPLLIYNFYGRDIASVQPTIEAMGQALGETQ